MLDLARAHDFGCESLKVSDMVYAARWLEAASGGLGSYKLWHSMKLYERVHENRLGNIVSISEEQRDS